MPETSPELAARIEILKASHAENPARFFMPLASAYREAGEVGRAEELLRENLKRHPGYLSAHVLLGRCLADRGAYAEARNEFQYVLSVDGQNLIALRTLGDMAAGGGDPAEARRWYGELLSVDPMNTEARNAVAALESVSAALTSDGGGEAGGLRHGGHRRARRRGRPAQRRQRRPGRLGLGEPGRPRGGRRLDALGPRRARGTMPAASTRSTSARWT